MNELHQTEILNMDDAELRAAHNVVFRQVNAPIFIGDREDRAIILQALTDEASNRGIL